MKRICWVLMILLLLSGCAQQEPVTIATISPGPASATVNSVDAFLSAIAPNTEILLEEGKYDFTTASDYGKESGNPYYEWVDAGDGYQLTIRDVDFLSIRGSGRELTEMMQDSRYANVMAFQNCSNLILEGFAAGHTEGGECAGGVIYLWNCEQAELVNLSLYGCGSTGIRADSCKNIAVRSSEIYECSTNAVQADNTDGLRLENCSIHDLGTGEYIAGQIFWLRQCTDVNIRQCSISDNRVQQIVNSQPAAGIELRGNTFKRNWVQMAVFSLNSGGLVMDDCDFEDNEIRRWLNAGDITILDGIGKSWTEDMLMTWYNPPMEPLPVDGLKQVVVSDVNELMAAIVPNTEIILKDGTYDLSEVKDYGFGWTNYHFWSEEFDGPALVITGIENLMIRSESGDPKKCVLSAVPRYADVLKFLNCKNITVSGITAGHTVEPGDCTGGVLFFENCDNILVNGCSLYGCGILGVRAEVCSAVAVTGCEIYECSYGGIQMGNVSGVRIENCSFRDLGGDALYFYECRNVTVDGQAVSGNSRLSY